MGAWASAKTGGLGRGPGQPLGGEAEQSTVHRSGMAGPMSAYTAARGQSPNRGQLALSGEYIVCVPTPQALHRRILY